MILFGPFGFLEFAAHKDRRLLWCYAWIPGDIERSFPEAEVLEVPPDLAERKWRRFKAAVDRGLAEVVALRAMQAVNYDSVYPRLPTGDHRRLLEDWQSGASGIAEWEWWWQHAKRPPPGVR